MLHYIPIGVSIGWLLPRLWHATPAAPVWLIPQSTSIRDPPAPTLHDSQKPANVNIVAKVTMSNFMTVRCLYVESSKAYYYTRDTVLVFLYTPPN